MASVVAHLIYAQKYFKKHPMPNGDEDLFMLGCVFPDIRRVDETIKRKDTHRCFDRLDLNFEGLSPFQAGWKFHLYCDMRREEILKKYKFYELDNAADFWCQPAKNLEDELLYEQYNNWEKLRHYFNNIPNIENEINVPPQKECSTPVGMFHREHPTGQAGNILRGKYDTMALWYAMIAKYIEKKPDSKAMKIFLLKQIGFADKAGPISEVVDKLRKNGKAVEILKKVAGEIV